MRGCLHPLPARLSRLGFAEVDQRTAALPRARGARLWKSANPPKRTLGESAFGRETKVSSWREAAARRAGDAVDVRPSLDGRYAGLAVPQGAARRRGAARGVPVTLYETHPNKPDRFSACEFPTVSPKPPEGRSRLDRFAYLRHSKLEN